MGGTQIRLPVGGGLSPSGVARGGRSCRATWRKASKRKSLTPSPRWPPGPGWPPDGGAGAGGAEVQHDVLFPDPPEVLPYRCGVVQGVGFGRVRRLVVRGVMGGGGVVGGGGHRCRAWGPVMGSLAAVAGGGFAVACVGGGIDIDWLVLAAACCVRGLVSGGGGGGWCGGGAVGGGGGGGGCCAGWGSGRPCGSCGCCVCAPCGPCGS